MTTQVRALQPPAPSDRAALRPDSFAQSMATSSTSVTSALAPALLARLPVAPPSRLDAPSLALAIIRGDVEAVAALLDAGAPMEFDAPVWGCTGAMEVASFRQELERARNYRFRNCRSLQSSAARQIARMVNAEVEARSQLVDVDLSCGSMGEISVAVALTVRDHTPCTWTEPLPEVLDAGARADVIQRVRSELMSRVCISISHVLSLCCECAADL